MGLVRYESPTAVVMMILAARLSEDLSAARENFTAGAIFAEAVNRARGMLTKIACSCHRRERAYT